MNLYQQIKADQLSARKTKDKLTTDVLSVLLATADKDLISRETEDVQHDKMQEIVISANKALLKSIETFANKPELVAQYKAEQDVIAKYLPKLLTEDEIKEIVIQNNFIKLPDLMKFLSVNYKGQFDPNLAKQVMKLKRELMAKIAPILAEEQHKHLREALMKKQDDSK